MCLVRFIKQTRAMRENRYPRATFNDTPIRNFFPIYETINHGKMIECGTLPQAHDAFSKSYGECKIIRVTPQGRKTITSRDWKDHVCYS